MASDLNPTARASEARGLAVKSSNPKDLLAVNRLPLWLIPPPAKVHQALAHLDGAKKYGPYNWRNEAVSYMQYISAVQRHLDDIIDGEDYAADSKVHHLGHAQAGLNIIADAMANGNLIDDRPAPGPCPVMHEGVQDFIAGVRDHYLDTPEKIGPDYERALGLTHLLRRAMELEEHEAPVEPDNACIEGDDLQRDASFLTDGELVDEVLSRGIDMTRHYRP
jgi:hypothetical protein